MTEGGIASWKKKEGETFEAGDVLLEIVSARRSVFACEHVFASRASTPISSPERRQTPV